MDKPLLIEKQGHIAWLTLNRPDRYNAMSMAMYEMFLEEMPKLDADDDVRVVVIKAAGKNFTSGIDLNDFTNLREKPTALMRERLRLHILHLQESMSVVEKCRKPVIAAVHGACIGGGVDLLSACDIRLCEAKSYFSIRETKMAIIADLGTLQRFHTIVGQGHYRELALTSRDFSAQEAMAMGFVTHVYDDQAQLLAEAEKMARQIAANPPLTVQGTKDLMNFTRDFGVQAGLQYVAQKNSAQIISEDLMEAIAAFMEKRPPQFKGN
ncbi:crotonase/enoyl-CoA hydratase family protein [Desulfarculus baarsii]